MPDVFLKVQEEGFGNVLVGVTPESHEWLQKKKPGKQFRANMKSSRNPGHHRKAFALFKLIADNHPTYNTVDDVLLEMKLRTNHYQEHIRAGNSKSANELRKSMNGFLLREDVMKDVLEKIDNLEREAKLVYMPKSISFDNMGQEEFEEFYDKCITVGCEMIGVRDEELRGELAQF